MSAPPRTLAAWERGIALVALARALLALAAALARVPLAPPPVAWPFVRPDTLEVLLFGAVGGFLLLSSRFAAPAAHLGGFLLAVSSAYATRLLAGLAAAGGLAPLRLLAALQVDAFLAYFLWAFVAGFPAAGAPAPRRLRFVPPAAALGGALFSLGNFLTEAALLPEGRARRIAAALSRSEDPYFRFVFTLAILAIPLAFAKARRTRDPERQRLFLFTLGITVGYGPVFFDSLAQSWIRSYEPVQPMWWRSTLLLLLATTPLTTAYAVLVHRVLDVRVVVRRAVRYALARGTVLAATVVPFTALLVHLAENRRRPLGDLLSGTEPLLLLAAAAAGTLALAGRRRLLDAIDRRFFREQYDAGRTLLSLVEQGRRAGSVEEMSELLEREVDRALHLTCVCFLAREAGSGRYCARAAGVPPLEPGSALVGLLEGSAEPLEADLSTARGPVARLPEGDRAWLEAAGVRLVVPFVGADGSVLGLLALGPKRSELPFSREDRALLSAIAASGAVALENRLLYTATGVTPPRGAAPLPAGASEELAKECLACGLVHPGEVAACACGAPLVPARIPYLVLRKFRLERRAGSGGMGVVYRAHDVTLGRTVALKTLPSVSPEYALRLRREARAGAALSHPAIALVYGAETWRDTPILVFEYLAAGTLADRLAGGALPEARVAALGVAIADALAAAHGKGVLHRDLKPSNIGFTEEERPKLLDFGLARILDDGRRERALPRGSGAPDSHAATSPMTLQTISASGGDGVVIGTPAYMSPEAVVGDPPDEGVDVWGLAVVLYEAATGKNPFLRANVPETMRAVLRTAAPDPRERVPGLSAAFAELLLDALALERPRRPATAAALRERLAALPAPGA